MAEPIDVLAVAAVRLDSARYALLAANAMQASGAAQYHHHIAAYQMHEAQEDLRAAVAVAAAIGRDLNRIEMPKGREAARRVEMR